jgi:acetylornithine deacetylase
MMDTLLFKEMLSVDSTSGRERALADFLVDRFQADGNKVERFDVVSMAGDVPEGSGIPQNLLFSWGKPKVVFCTHLDTVPPFIAPEFDDDGKVRGRGTCDAKGQIFAMWEACKALADRGYDGFGLLLLAGEETGSYGAKAFREQHPGAEWVIVGEPTDNCMASAAKGTKSFEVTFTGNAFHSGYPQFGVSAVELFNDFVNALRSIRFPLDETLGETTWNIGRLSSDNPQNILSDKLTCRVYFRTTFESDEMVCNIMKNIAGEDAKLRFGRPRVQDGSDVVAKDVAPWQKAMSVQAFGGDSPSRFDVMDGFEAKPVAFGSDAPQLTGFPHKILCGPGSILVAHRDDEHILLKDIEAAVDNYINIFETIRSTTLKNWINIRSTTK